MAPHIKPFPERFWLHVRRTHACWLWIGALRGNGYGAFWIGSRATGGHRPAHRVMWEMVNGPIPVGQCVLHRCDVRSCVRPDHLFVGDHRDNMRDMAIKGRAATGTKSGRYTKPGRTARGEKNGNSKLTQAGVDAIRVSYSDGGTSLQILADEYEVSKKTILNIIHGRIWI